MLLALIFWLSEIHIMTTTLRTSLHEISFHDANLYQLAKGSVITSIVSISICFFNNIIGVVAAVDGIRTLMIGVSKYKNHLWYYIKYFCMIMHSWGLVRIIIMLFLCSLCYAFICLYTFGQLSMVIIFHRNVPSQFKFICTIPRKL